MKAGDFSGSAGRLHDAWQVLHQQWQDASQHWRDARQREFGEHYIDPLEPLVQRTIERMNRLAGEFVQARQDCALRDD